jgi:hypothetical protein
MSRTYNTKHDFNKNYGKVVYPNGYEAREPDVEYDEVDMSHTTQEGPEAHYLTVRHPNKRKKRGSLDREFKNVGMSSPSYWKNRFGEVYDKSSRMRLIKREMTQTRRHRMKHDAEEETSRA